SYDVREPLIIDPVLSYSTFIGGSGGDGASSVAVDSAGNTYVTGTTFSPDFPTANALQPDFGSRTGCSAPRGAFSPPAVFACPNVFVAKLNAAGSAFTYVTFLGGARADTGNGIAVDSAGNAYVSGTTDSSDFPLVNPLMTRGSS